MSLPANVEVTSGRIARRWIERGLSVGMILFGGLVLMMPPEAFSAPIDEVLWQWIPARVAGLIWFGLGVVRIVVLIINGWWPVSPQARLSLSLGSLVSMWIPLCVAFWWIGIFNVSGGVGSILPGVMLAPLVAWSEAMAAVQLVAWLQARKKG